MQLQLETSKGNAQHDLIVFAEGLNLEKLFKVQQVLTEWMSFDVFRPGLEMQKGFAVETSVNVLNTEQLQQKLEQVATALQIEIAVLENRPTLAEPGLLLMDMDSTVIGIECIDEIAKIAGVGEQVSEVTELAMQGKLDFAESLRSRVACLKGADEKVLYEVLERLPINPGISALLDTLRHANWKLAIASGGFTYFANYLKERLSLDYAISNTLEIADGKLTGQVLGEIIGAQAKADTLKKLSKDFNLKDSQTIALGDGANDLVMMGQAALGVAYHAKPIVRQQAAAALRFSGADSLLAFLRRK
ncbi:phosphoserine phosphatase SerB [Aliiglaciecola sp. M165]|nr:phosphoserine phosphatase SerB [Aliiglaciecola sp. M165]